MIRTLQRTAALLLCALLLCAGLPQTASAKTMAEWLAGYESAENWFGEDFAYDITDTAACWELLMKPITVLDVGEKESVYPLVEPGGKKVNNDKLGGFINGSTAAVHVLGEDEDGWTLIEGLDYYDRLIRGYVKTKLLKTVTPDKTQGIIIDKLTQRMYVFINGEFFSSCAVSTGLVNDEQPYNESSAGEYITASRVGAFDSEGMICDMAIRYNNGDLLHQVPYVLLADGTKKFDKFEAQLGQKASHGCIRVARTPNDDGLCQQWLWNNIKKNTKVVIWDDDGRVLPYPDDNTDLYYNTDGGKYYHSTATCNSVKSKFYPLTGFKYYELDTSPYSKLDPCPSCSPPKRKAQIDKLNKSRGVGAAEDVQAAFAASDDPDSVDTGDDHSATQHPVEITILSPE